jgi:hypothetical protein
MTETAPRLPNKTFFKETFPMHRAEYAESWRDTPKNLLMAT